VPTFLFRQENHSGSQAGSMPFPVYRCAKTKKKEVLSDFLFESGAGEESRTLDLNLGKVALYQLSYSRISLQTTAALLKQPYHY
jgi:hypothetical protein